MFLKSLVNLRQWKVSGSIMVKALTVAPDRTSSTGFLLLVIQHIWSTTYFEHLKAGQIVWR
ncbi:unnamed protein product [Ceratitis capitata]|uniref:(Mediterranean fruit fly) hypothetical protein n=1 Tax=Ceratitis capitata TaxID=7213 RepID=A0A811V3P0_CERCA|nr:unnamed protein product [Ceratitis capitata]